MRSAARCVRPDARACVRATVRENQVEPAAPFAASTPAASAAASPSAATGTRDHMSSSSGSVPVPRIAACSCADVSTGASAGPATRPPAAAGSSATPWAIEAAGMARQRIVASSRTGRERLFMAASS